MDNKTERLLEAYFAHALTQAEMTEIKMLLAEDPSFAAELAWRQSLERAVRTGADNDPFKIRLQELERRFRFKKITFQITALAAVFILAISAIWFFNQNPDSTQTNGETATKHDTGISTQQPPAVTVPSPDPNVAQKAPTAAEIEKDRRDAADKLKRQREAQETQRILRDSLQNAAIANFRHYKNVTDLNTAGGVKDAKAMAVIAFSLYDKAADEKGTDREGVYKKAAQAFKPVVEADPDNLEYQFFYGVALLGSKQFETAVKTLQPVTENQSQYQDAAKFYLGLAHSGTGQYKEARQAFQAYLAAPDNRKFKVVAEDMLKKLPPQ